MLDFENGIRDLVKRIDNVTIQLAGLFCNLESELTELYLLNKNNFDKNNHNFAKKSELIDRMKELLKESLISNDYYSDDEYLIIMDNSVMSLESLTSVVMGTRSYVNCSIINENENKKTEEFPGSLYSYNLNLKEVNENSNLISICRNLNRLTKHRLKIEKYDADVNNELNSINKDQNKLLENKLRETEVKLRNKEIQCYAYEKQIGFLKEDIKQLYKTQKSSDVQEITCKNCSLIYSKDVDFESHDLINVKKHSFMDVSDESSEVSAHNNEPLNKLIKMLNNKDILENGKSDLRDNTSIQESLTDENLEILKLNDQLQLLNIDIQLLREENNRLKLKIKEKEEFLKNYEDEQANNNSENLYNIMYHEGQDIENNSRKSELEVVRQQDLNIHEIIGNSNTPQRPCLVMWEPIVENSIDTSNIVPISISSYGQYKKSKNETRRSINYIMEGKGIKKRVVINRNLFYCNLEEIIRKNTK